MPVIFGQLYGVCKPMQREREKKKFHLILDNIT